MQVNLLDQATTYKRDTRLLIQSALPWCGSRKATPARSARSVFSLLPLRPSPTFLWGVSSGAPFLFLSPQANLPPGWSYRATQGPGFVTLVTVINSYIWHWNMSSQQTGSAFENHSVSGGCCCGQHSQCVQINTSKLDFSSPETPKMKYFFLSTLNQN